MRPFRIITAVLFDLAYRASGIGVAYLVGTETAGRIHVLFSNIATAMPG